MTVQKRYDIYYVMKIRIKVKDAILITISLILLWISYFLIKDYEIHVTDTGGYVSTTKERPAKHYIDLAKAEYWKGNYEGAIKLWEKALNSDPYHPESIYHDIGMTYVLLYRYEDAVEPLNKAVELGADYDTTYYYLGEAYFYLGNNSKAKENYEKVVSVERQKSDQEVKKLSYERLGRIEELTGNPQKAQEYFEKANQL